MSWFNDQINEAARALDAQAIPYEDWSFAFPELIGFHSGQPIYWWKKGIPWEE